MVRPGWSSDGPGRKCILQRVPCAVFVSLFSLLKSKYKGFSPFPGNDFGLVQLLCNLLTKYFWFIATALRFFPPISSYLFSSTEAEEAWREEFVFVLFCFSGPLHIPLLVILIVNPWCHTLPFCVFYLGLRFRTIIWKLQFLVLICMWRLHWFNYQIFKSTQLIQCNPYVSN